MVEDSVAMLGVLVEWVGGGVRVQLILLPAQGVGLDVLCDALVIGLVAEDVFVVIALPDGCAVHARQFPGAFGHPRFPLTDDGTKRLRWRPAGST